MRKSYKQLYCIYCGEKATTEEHFPPASLSTTGYLFSSCLECNLLASDNHPFNFEKRNLYVKDKIKSRILKNIKDCDLGSKEWFDDKIEIQRNRLDFSFTSYLANSKLEVEDVDYILLKSSTRKKFNKICVICNKNFVTNTSRQLYCGKDCGKEHRTKRSGGKVTAECIICNTTFKKNRWQVVYCSTTCNDEHRKQKLSKKISKKL